MKTFALCSGLGLVAFLVGFQSGLFEGEADPEDAAQQEKKKPPVQAKPAEFPAALAPAGRGQSVPQAAPYDPLAKKFLMVVMEPNGTLHRWNEDLAERHDDWRAVTVEMTQLVLVVGKQKEKLLEVVKYPKAPSVYRYQYDLETSVVAARTGEVVANRVFRNQPRPIRDFEDWKLTKIGKLVTFKTVINWVMTQARQGFSEGIDPGPVVTVVD